MDVNENISNEEKYRLTKMYEISKGVVIDYILNVVNNIDGFVGGTYREVFAFDHTYEEIYREPLILKTQNPDEFINVDFQLLDSYNFDLDDIEMTNLIYQVSMELINLGFHYITDHMVVDKINKDLLQTIHFCVDQKSGMLVPISISSNQRQMIMLAESYEELKSSNVHDDIGFTQKIADYYENRLNELSKLCTEESKEYDRQLTLKLIKSKNIYPVYKKISSADIPHTMRAKIL